MTSYYSTTHFYKKKLPTPATFSGNSLRINQRRIKEKAKTREGLRVGRKTIRQVAGHEIHLEIEDVQDKKNLPILQLVVNCTRGIVTFRLCRYFPVSEK